MSLYKIDRNLDNLLKNLNRKMITSARVSARSSVYLEGASIIKQLENAGARVYYKDINGVKVPQVSRGAGFWANVSKMPPLNQGTVASGISRMKSLGTITSEIIAATGSPVSGGNYKSAVESYKNVKKQKALNSIHGDVMNNTYFATLQRLTGDTAVLNLVGAIYDGRYVEGYADYLIDAESKLEEYKEQIEDMKTELAKAEPYSNEWYALNYEIHEMEENYGEATTALEELKNRYNSIMERKYGGKS